MKNVNMTDIEENEAVNFLFDNVYVVFSNKVC